jgi:23S rRNA (cytidine1920-2'-O)/16S rRNA (cytidine1409-2'-O)-methyltransferase
MILAGAVLVAEECVDKAGTLVDPEIPLRIKGETSPYVSRGGLKLKGALETFEITVGNLVVLDAGASTGGFTDCLLQEGAKKVYALDVGYGQLAWQLRQDPRVVVIERTNIRYFDGRGIEEELDMATVDASFISLKLIIPPICRLVRQGGFILALIKPQFEVGRKQVGKHGVVREPALHQQVVDEMKAFFQETGLEVLGTCESPLVGPAGNREFFIYAKNLK